MQNTLQSKKRLENGLIDGVEYVYLENGRINWLKMIPEEYLYINQDPKRIARIEKQLSKPISEVQKNEVRDTDLVITLQGLRYLLDLRGYKQSKIKLDYASPEYAAASCEIAFLPNLEENFEQVFTACACAHKNNTKSFYQGYLVEAASNRALCRAVRQFLKINIVSNEELGAEKDSAPEESGPTENPMSPRFLLQRIILEKNLTLPANKQITFANIHEKLIKEGVKGADGFQSIDDIPKDIIFGLIDRIKKIK